MFVSTDENLGAVVECSRSVGVGGAMPNHWSCEDFLLLDRVMEGSRPDGNV